jgi:hypothetical protein
VGDRTYGLPAESGTPGAELSRQFLHAYSLTLRRYPNHALCTFIAPLADDLMAWLERHFSSGVQEIKACE